MQSKALVLFLSTLAFFAAPTLAVLGDNDYLADDVNVFNAHNLHSAKDWHSDQELVAFLEGRVKSFIGKDFLFEGASLAENLEFLANADLFPLIDEPLTDSKVLEKAIKNVLISYKKKILSSKIDNDQSINEIVNSLVQEVRDLVNRHIIAVILKTGKVPEEELKLDFKEVMESVKSTTTEISKRDNEKKNEFKTTVKELNSKLKKILSDAIASINYDLSNYLEKSFQLLSVSINNLYNEMSSKKVNLQFGADRMNALIDAIISGCNESPYEVARLINSLYWKNTSDKEVESVMRKILSRTVSKVFDILIQDQTTEEVSKSIKEMIVFQYLAHGQEKLFFSQTYCSYFNYYAENGEIKFGDETDSEREAKIKILGTTDYLYSLAACTDNKISAKDLKVIVKNIDKIYLLEEKHRAIIDLYPQFMKIKGFDVNKDFELINSLHQLYINFRIDVGFKPSAEGVLEGLLDGYLDKVIAAGSQIGSEKFRQHMQEYSFMLKIMIAMPGQFPEDHVISLKELGTDEFEKFAIQFNQCHFLQLKKFVASLYPHFVNSEFKSNGSNYAPITDFEDITLEKIREKVKVDEIEKQSD